MRASVCRGRARGGREGRSAGREKRRSSRYSKQEAICQPRSIFTSLTRSSILDLARDLPSDTRRQVSGGDASSSATAPLRHYSYNRTAMGAIVPDVFRADCRIGHGGAGGVCDCVATRRAYVTTTGSRAGSAYVSYAAGAYACIA